MKLKTFSIFCFSCCILLIACNQRVESDDSDTMVAVVDPADAPQESVSSDPFPEPESPVPASKNKNVKVTPKPKPAAVTLARNKANTHAAKPKIKTKSTPETIYVETYGAQGKVWGHVTLNGDRGTGTIHDFDENTLSVTVTRHGNELFAVDQNSRQYVFKLKQ